MLTALGAFARLLDHPNMRPHTKVDWRWVRWAAFVYFALITPRVDDLIRWALGA